MKLLFVGGTGIISTACAELAIAQGHSLTLLTRGKHDAAIPGATQVTGDINDAAGVAALLDRQAFDVAVDWTVFRPADIERDIAYFSGRVGQYVFISSASIYQKPAQHFTITETTPRENPFWQYSRDKIECENLLFAAFRSKNFPATIIRPSLTYGKTQIPLALNSWELPYTIVDRMRRGRPVIVPGDGTSWWTITHNTDFAKGLLALLGKNAALGEAYNITSNESRTWDYYYRAVAKAAGCEAKLVHIGSEFITDCVPDLLGSLWGDKNQSVQFDNSKLLSLAPDFRCTTDFAAGIRQTIAWFDEKPERRKIDERMEPRWEALLEGHRRGIQAARQLLAP